MPWRVLGRPSFGAASFQATAIEVLIDRTRRALEGPEVRKAGVRSLVVAGGVAANEMLSRSLEDLTDRLNFRLCVPPPALCTDNGAMVAWAGLERAELGLFDGLGTAARARWPLDSRRAGLAGAKS